MKPIDKILAKSTGHLYHFEVPEWSDDETPFIIYHKAFTLSDIAHIERVSDSNKARTLAHTVILKCLNEDETKMFTLQDLPKLMRSVKSDIVVNIVNKLNAPDGEVDYPE